MFLLLAGYAISSIGLLRTLLIIMGLYKDPILHRFEKYGDEEDFYRPLPPLLAWLGVFIILNNMTVVYLWGVMYPFTPIGALLIGAAYLVHHYHLLSGDSPDLILGYPQWLNELRHRTTRLERRRMAYMWLRLPRKLRLIYNSNDRAFLEWADMVILSTLM